jgi:dynein assembly factor 3, axonemal
LHYLTPSLISDEEPHSCLKEIFSFKGLKFKERDEMLDIFNTWWSREPYDMEGYRDQRLRYLWKTRYDYRKNMADFQYHFKLKDKAPIVRYRQYVYWHMHGIAFDSRFNTYITPNRTMNSYLPGHRVSQPP